MINEVTIRDILPVFQKGHSRFYQRHLSVGARAVENFTKVPSFDKVDQLSQKFYKKMVYDRKLNFAEI